MTTTATQTIDKYRVCFCFRRKFKLGMVKPPEDVESIFEKYSENRVMNTENLRRFLVEEQGEKGATVEYAHSIIESLKSHNLFNRKGLLDLNGFFRFLMGDKNLPLSPDATVHHDMTAPLSHYFIYTGHNSYLTGNQLSSDCSDVPIIKALKRGVRVIELDIWPNSTKDGVDVLHGRTLTTPVALINCLRSIKDNAFSASPYPLVITLEDHLTPDLQAKVAQMLHETFGDMLFCPGSESMKDFPSPESLKHRIIISTKPPKEYMESETLKDKDVESKREVGEEAWGTEISDNKEIGKADGMQIDIEDDDDDDEDGEQRVVQKAAPEYKRLIAISAGKPKGGLRAALKVEPDKVRRVSLSEQELEKGTVTHGTDLVRFTQKNLLRIYPKGTRFNSSNYNPFVGWMHGAQMVAFNMQGYGRSLWLMHGFFKANGGCGYIKKPDFLLRSDPLFDPREKMPVKKTLKVKIYLGDGWQKDFKRTHFDAFSPPDFYTRVGISGVPADSVMTKTKTIEDDWSPAWNQEFEFPLTVPELALLRIEVHEYDMSEKDDFGGQTCLPISELRTGIRSVPLLDKKGQTFNNVKLLVQFKFI